MKAEGDSHKMWTYHIKCDIVIVRRAFIETKIFEKTWKNAGYDDKDLRSLQSALLDNPEVGTGIAGGMRKYPHPFGSGGKSGGSRIIYYDYKESGQIYLIYCFRKNEQDNLTDAQKKALSITVKSIKGGA